MVEAKRKAIFRESMIRSDANNAINGEPVFGVTKFSDMTLKEYSILLGRRGHGAPVPKQHSVKNPLLAKTPVSAAALPPVVDW